MKTLRRTAVAALALAALLAACDRPGPAPSPRFHLGNAYQAAGNWYYPTEAYALVQTGLAAVATAGKSGLTANGEAYDDTAMAAGHQTLQLPAIARVTNLATGTQLTLRINDRGPARPNRALELTPRAASLLGIPKSGGTPIRIEVLEAESRAAIEGLRGAPKLTIATAPREAIRAESLSGPAVAQPASSQPEEKTQEGQGATPTIPRLPETVTRAAAGPTTLWIRLGSFSRQEFAARQSARVASLNPSLETERAGRQITYKLRIGPLASVADADATLDRVIRAGITDARIVVE